MRMGAGAKPRQPRSFWGLLLLALVAALVLQAWPGRRLRLQWPRGNCWRI